MEHAREMRSIFFFFFMLFMYIVAAGFDRLAFFKLVTCQVADILYSEYVYIIVVLSRKKVNIRAVKPPIRRTSCSFTVLQAITTRRRAEIRIQSYLHVSAHVGRVIDRVRWPISQPS